jgi:predicted amidohydrolase YtcJ
VACETSADWALINGTILTMNQCQPCAAAVAIRGDRILKVGTNKEISHLIGKDTKIISLDRKTVVPGFIDTHIHIADFARFLMWMDLTRASSIKEMQCSLKERVQITPKGKWIVGRGWDEKRFAEKLLPTRFDLDAVSTDNPVIFYYACGPLCVVNSCALKLAGITKETTAPLGGAIDKDTETGEPTGILRETATDLVWRLIPEHTNQELAEAAEMALKKVAETGITSIHWLATSQIDVVILQTLCKEKKLPLRIYMIIPVNLLNSLDSGEDFDDEFARIGGVEVSLDGYLASDTAALLQPYNSDLAVKGKVLCTPAKLRASANKINKAGFQLVLHAMGDKAIETALNTIEALKKKGRHRIDQAALLNEGLIHRIKQTDVVLSVQPLVAASEFSVYFALEHLGPARARWLYPLKTLFKEGIRVCGGSDCPMEPLNPLLGIQSVVTRQVFPEERVTVDEALRMYTVYAAYASCEENIKGSIEEGKLADFTVLSLNPHMVNPNEIQNIAVDMTIVGGKVVFQRLNL